MSTMRVALAVALGVLFVVGQPGVAKSKVLSAPASAQLTPEEEAELEAMLSGRLQQIIASQANLSAEQRASTAVVDLDFSNGVVTIGLETALLPPNDPVENEEIEGLLSEEIIDLVRGVFAVQEVKFLYGGSDIFHYFPVAGPQRASKSAVVTPYVVVGRVGVSAGHGQYFNHGGIGAWVAQRDASNGVTEDYITPVFTSELGTWLGRRSNKIINYTRSQLTTIHAPSGLPWSKLGSRYFLADTYPYRADVWASRSATSTSNDRERIDDIYARPLFANWLDVDLISIHTNAAASSATRGTRVYYYGGRGASRDLAEKVICGLKETVNGNPDYKEWDIQNLPIAANQAETREVSPTRKAVLVEAGFHTSPLDAAIMQQPAFVTALAKGIARGYKMSEEGKECVKFEIAAAETTLPSPIPRFTPFKVSVTWKGNPPNRYTEHMWVVAEELPGSCLDQCQTLEHPVYQLSEGVYPNPAQFDGICIVPGGFTTWTRNFKLYLKDEDGVLTEPFEFSYTCGL